MCVQLTYVMVKLHRGAVDVVQLLECLPSMHKSLVQCPELPKLVADVHRNWGPKVGGQKNQAHSILYHKFVVSLGYRRPQKQN